MLCSNIGKKNAEELKWGVGREKWKSLLFRYLSGLKKVMREFTPGYCRHKVSIGAF